jgi:hypothetical protein
LPDSNREEEKARATVRKTGNENQRKKREEKQGKERKSKKKKKTEEAYDASTDFEFVSDDARIVHQSVQVGLTVLRDLLIVEVIKSLKSRER